MTEADIRRIVREEMAKNSREFNTAYNYSIVSYFDRLKNTDTSRKIA